MRRERENGRASEWRALSQLRVNDSREIGTFSSSAPTLVSAADRTSFDDTGERRAWRGEEGHTTEEDCLERLRGNPAAALRRRRYEVTMSEFEGQAAAAPALSAAPVVSMRRLGNGISGQHLRNGVEEGHHARRNPSSAERNAPEEAQPAFAVEALVAEGPPHTSGSDLADGGELLVDLAPQPSNASTAEAVLEPVMTPTPPTAPRRSTAPRSRRPPQVEDNAPPSPAAGTTAAWRDVGDVLNSAAHETAPVAAMPRPPEGLRSSRPRSASVRRHSQGLVRRRGPGCGGSFG